MAKFLFLIFCASTLIFEMGQGEPQSIQFTSCPPKEGVDYSCDITDVKIDPCKQAAENKPCKIKKGKFGGITLHFKPRFDTEKLIGEVFWATKLEPKFLGLDSDACHFTTCPIVANNEYVYSFNLTVSRAHPAGQYDVKWKLRTEQNQECCAIFKIKLIN